MRRVALVLLLAAACGGDGGGTELRHEQPGFRARVPVDFKVGADRRDPSGGGNLSVASADLSQEVFFTWSPSGSPTDPVPQFDRHRAHEDLTKIVSEGTLPGGARYFHIERGNRVYVHSAVSSDGFGIECTVSWPVAEPASAALAEACKTLQPGTGGGAGAGSSAGGGGRGGARDTFGARPSMPAPLAKLRFGMPLEEVKASWPEALEYEFHPTGMPGVERVNVMFDSGRALRAVFIHLARGTGKALVSSAWGPGTDAGMSDIGPKTTWPGPDGITAELSEQSTGDVLVIGLPPR